MLFFFNGRYACLDGTNDLYLQAGTCTLILYKCVPPDLAAS